MKDTLAKQLSEEPPRSVLIVLMGAIGDVARGLPLAVNLKKRWPEVKITWAVEPISRPLVEQHSAIDRVLCFDRPKGFLAYCSFIKDLRKEDFDLCLDLQRHIKSGVTSLLSGSNLRVGFDRANAREGNWLFNTHRIADQDRFSPKLDQFLAFLELLGFDDPVVEFGLGSTAQEQANVEEKIRSEQASHVAERSVAFLLGSTWESRIWFADRYAEVAEEIWKRWNLVPILLGTKAEKAIADEILSLAKNVPIVDLVEKTSLREVVAVLERSSYAVGSDSGPMHIASAVGTKIVSLWGATSPIRSGPYGSMDHMIQSPIGCSPCYKRKCPGLGRLCMKDIPAKAVLAQFESLQRISEARKVN